MSAKQSQNIDRKSTRLNSSHSQISYAVFCLKKIKSVAVSKIAFHFEIKLLRKISRQIDPCPTQAEPVVDLALAEISIESERIAAFRIDLDKATQHQLQFRSTLLDVNRRFLFDYRPLRVRLSVI